MDGLILAGGENRRIQIQKGLLEFNGKKIIETALELFEKNFKRVFISTNSPEIFFYLGFPMIGDILNYRGPMTGIFSSFCSSSSSELFVAACDMPFINSKLIRLIVSKYNGQDAVIPVFNGKPQPLLGIYSRKITDVMEERIKSEKRSMIDLLKYINVYYINEDVIAEVDPDGRSFVNINTFEEYEKELNNRK
jgi:molybdopterin-guanine dinucleotide biosynthesis protein A